MNLHIQSVGLMKGRIFQMYFKIKYISFENAFKMLAFDKIFSIDFYIPFKLFPIKEISSFHVKSIYFAYIYILNHSCFHLVYPCVFYYLWEASVPSIKLFLCSKHTTEWIQLAKL